MESPPPQKKNKHILQSSFASATIKSAFKTQCHLYRCFRPWSVQVMPSNQTDSSSTISNLKASKQISESSYLHGRMKVATWTELSWCGPNRLLWKVSAQQNKKQLGQVGVIFPKGIMETQISTASCYKQVTNHVNQVTSNVDWEGSWSWRTWRFPQACVFGGQTVLYTASSGSRIQNSNTVNGQIPPPVWKVWNTYGKSKKNGTLMWTISTSWHARPHQQSVANKAW